jgi:putative ABC transport system substrate-binding protein
MSPKRRRYLYLACAAMMVLPTLAAGRSPSTPRIGLLAWSSCGGPPNEPGLDEFTEFVRGLDDLGYKPGETVIFECRHAGRRYDGLETAAAALVRLPVDIIVTTSQPAGRAARRVTDTVPIVTIVSGDPVADGLARSLAKPGGNLTGVSYYATELTAKRLEFLKKLMPAITTVGVLANPEVSYLPFEADTRRAAEQLGLGLKIREVSAAAALESAFATMKADGVQAVFVLPDLMLAWESDRIAALALKYRLPCMAWGGWYAQEGCLMAYSADYDEMDRRLAFYVDRILKGARPGDLPIEQPTKFKLWVNLKTAKALDVEVPRTLLLLADEVIE